MTDAARLRAVAVDALLAGVVIAVGLVQYATRNFAELGPRPPADALATAPDALGLLLVAVAGLAVLGRRRVPLAALALTCAAAVAALALGYGVIVHLGPAAVLYAIAEQSSTAQRRWGAALAATAFVPVAVLEWQVLEARGDFAIDAILWSGAWAAGAQRRVARGHAAQRRRHELQLATVEERARIARELHDSAGHAITTILAHAGAARVLRERDPARADAAIETVETLARRTIDEIDQIVGALRDEGGGDLRPLPRLGDVAELVERHRAGGLPVTLAVTGDRELPAALDRAAYRIVQEALTNATRHGDGAARVEIRFAADALELTVANATAADRTTRAGGGRGLTGMRERAKLLGGMLTVDDADGSFVVHARLPYDGGRT